jgi:hypothetical protein
MSDFAVAITETKIMKVGMFEDIVCIILACLNKTRCLIHTHVDIAQQLGVEQCEYECGSNKLIS